MVKRKSFKLLYNALREGILIFPKKQLTLPLILVCASGGARIQEGRVNSMLQSTPTLSTTEAKYMATVEVAKEALWLTGLVKELGLKQEGLELNCDNQSSIHLANNQVYYARTKHIDVWYHTIRERIEEGKLNLIKVHAENNAADMLAKPVSTQKFKHCLSLINLLHC